MQGCPERLQVCEETHLNLVSVVEVYGEIGAACMTGRNILDSIRATHRVKSTADTGAVCVAQGPAGDTNKRFPF